MNGEEASHHTIPHCVEAYDKCQLCGQAYANDVSSTPPAISFSFISKHMGIKLNSTNCLPPLLCASCIQQITVWQNFVQQCQTAQSLEGPVQGVDMAVFQPSPDDRLTEFISCDDGAPLKDNESLPPEIPATTESPESDPAAESEVQMNGSNKKSRFTLDYLEQKIGRRMEGNEVDEMMKLINKGDDRAIYALLFGSGANQSWQCQLCSHLIKGTMKEVAKHYLNEHQASPLYPCQLCGKVIKSSHTYKRHRTAHLSEYKCPSCEKVFQDRSKLLAHKVAHSDNRPHVCSECGKQYKLASHLKSHVARAHLPESDRLAFTCEKCGKRFSAKGNLTTHVQTTHSDSRPFVCDLCGKGVKTKQALQFHLNSHNGVKQFSCNICSMSFTSRSSMASHTRRHTGEKPYPCKQCGKTFTSSSARSSHRQHVHATSRQHVCSFCSKSFKVLRDLKVHQSIHTGEKPYVCDTCGKAFRVAANFYAHRKTHRKAAEKEAISSNHKVVKSATLLQSVEPFDEAQQHQQEADPETIHTLQMAQPVAMNDALSQAIREHLTQSGLGDVQLDSLQPNYEVGGVVNTSDGIEYASIIPEEQISSNRGYYKQILLGQFDQEKE